MSVIALLPDCMARIRVRAALELDCSLPQQIYWADDWRDVHARASHSPAELLIFDLYANGVYNMELCADFHTAFPSIVMLPYSAAPLNQGMDLLRLAAIGVHTAMVQDAGDTPTALGMVIGELLAQGTAGRVLLALDKRIPKHLLAVVSHLLRVAYRPVTPGELARVYHRHPRTLREHLKSAGLPCTEKFIGWARLFHAAHRLSDSRRTIEGVALALEFPSASAFRNQLWRYVGITPRYLTSAGGLDYLLKRFTAQCG